MRPRFCVDASVLGRWLLAEGDAAVRVETLLTAFEAGEVDLCAPDLLVSQVGNLLVTAVRGGRLDPVDALEALEAFCGLGLRWIDARQCAAEALLTARTLGLSFYDALYVAVAEAEGCALLTADTRLAERVRERKPFVIPLEEWTPGGWA